MNKLIVRKMTGGSFQWQWFSGDNQSTGGVSSGSGNLDVLIQAVSGQQAEVWLLLPGENFLIKTVEFSDKEKRHLRQAVPYQLEELLIDDIEALHFALGKPADGLVSVAACNREWLKEQLTPFEDTEIEVVRVIPESLLLARNTGWALRLTGKSVLAHTAKGQGFVMEPELALEGLKILRKEVEEENLPVLVTASNQQALDHFSELLEDIPGLEIENWVQPWWQSIDVEATPEIDLRQGEFGRKLPVERWWFQWRNVAIVAGVTLTAYLLVSLLQYNFLQNENLALRQQIEKQFRSVVPRGVIVDAEKQLRSKVKALQGGGQGSSYAISTLAKVAPVIVGSGSEGVTIRAIHYSADTNEMRVSFWASSFNVIEQARSAIAELGMEVELVQASADGDGHQARLRVRGSNG